MTASVKPRAAQSLRPMMNIYTTFWPSSTTPTNITSRQSHLRIHQTDLKNHTYHIAKMVKLEEVMDEEFVREQDGPHDEDDWDTDSGTYTP